MEEVGSSVIMERFFFVSQPDTVLILFADGSNQSCMIFEIAGPHPSLIKSMKSSLLR